MMRLRCWEYTAPIAKISSRISAKPIRTRGFSSWLTNGWTIWQRCPWIVSATCSTTSSSSRVMHSNYPTLTINWHHREKSVEWQTNLQAWSRLVRTRVPSTATQWSLPAHSTIRRATVRPRCSAIRARRAWRGRTRSQSSRHQLSHRQAQPCSPTTSPTCPKCLLPF